MEGGLTQLGNSQSNNVKRSVLSFMFALEACNKKVLAFMLNCISPGFVHVILEIKLPPSTDGF